MAPGFEALPALEVVQVCQLPSAHAAVAVVVPSSRLCKESAPTRACIPRTLNLRVRQDLSSRYRWVALRQLAVLTLLKSAVQTLRVYVLVRELRLELWLLRLLLEGAFEGLVVDVLVGELVRLQLRLLL